MIGFVVRLLFRLCLISIGTGVFLIVVVLPLLWLGKKAMRFE